MPKYFICPMSKNIVDAVCELDSNIFGFTVTRRQIDYNDGYVNGWNTKSFYEYVKSKNSSILLERDHGGPLQGTVVDNGLDSFKEDLNYFDLIHLDPWKQAKHTSEGLALTTSTLLELYQQNPKVKYEVLTEAAIKQFDHKDYKTILSNLRFFLAEAFDSIEYVVVQSGVKIDLVSMKNTDKFLTKPLATMIKICKDYGKKTKEHNGDYLSKEEKELRFHAGIDAINIGPELVQLETEIYLEHMTELEKNSFYEVCLASEKWKRWITPEFNSSDKDMVIRVCGHYNYDKLPLKEGINDIIKDTIKYRLNGY
jgi:hypothetical protein